MTVSLASVTPIPADASEEIKLWVMELAGEIAAKLDDADKDIITQVKVGGERDLGECRLKLSLVITAESTQSTNESDSPKKRRR
ncbi:MAG: hypothetical protein NVSMB52_02390 [Chloroflexota bacterium]